MTQVVQPIEDAAFSFEWTGADRRESPRKVLRVRARVGLPDETMVDARTVDLSSGGLSLTSSLQLKPDQECFVELELGAFGIESTPPIRTRVCYCVPFRASDFRTGVQFLQIDAAIAALIAAALK